MSIALDGSIYSLNLHSLPTYALAPSYTSSQSISNHLLRLGAATLMHHPMRRHSRRSKRNLQHNSSLSRIPRDMAQRTHVRRIQRQKNPVFPTGNPSLDVRVGKSDVRHAFEYDHVPGQCK